MHTGFKDTCEEVSFKASFEGREGRAVMESEGKRIPDLCLREAEDTTTVLFSLEGGDAKHHPKENTEDVPLVEFICLVFYSHTR